MMTEWGRQMANARADSSPDNKLRTPLETLRLDRTAFSVVSMKDAAQEDKEYWRTQPTRARLQAVELMRQVFYGYNPISDRIERVLEVTKRTSR
jgi:hypothetical protein